MNQKEILEKLSRAGGFLISNERDGFAYEFSCYENVLSICSMDHNRLIGLDVKWEDVKILGNTINVVGTDDYDYKIHMEFMMVIPFEV